MLTYEVITMYKKILLMLFAVMQLVCANLTAGYKVTVGGKPLPGTFSKEQLRQSEIVRCAAVDEITRDGSAPAEYTVSRRIGFIRADGDVKALCDAMICSSPGVARCCEIYIGGNYCGTVSDPGELQDYAVPVMSAVRYKPVYSYVGRPSDFSKVCGIMEASAIGLHNS
jgi:hypothetical protein